MQLPHKANLFLSALIFKHIKAKRTLAQLTARREDQAFNLRLNINLAHMHDAPADSRAAKVNLKMLLHKPSDRKRFVLTAAAVLVIAFAGMAVFQEAQAAPAKTYRQEAQIHAGMPIPLKKSPVHLYFMARSNYFLMSEHRVVVHAEGRVSLARAIVEALIKGPQEDLLKTMPSGTRLNAIYVSPDSVCYVDLSEEIRSNHPGGISTELLTIYSIVNSLILNVPEIDRVKILIDGNEAITLAGHINLQFPAKANMLLIR